MANKKSFAELTVQADMRFLNLLQQLVAGVAAPAQLPEKQLKELEVAVKEAFTNCVEHAYEPGQADLVFLTAELDREKMVISLRDRGRPFDASLEPAYGMLDTSALDRENMQGQGLHLIRSIMDEVQWICLGTEGKKLQMTRYLHRDHLDFEIEPRDGSAQEDDMHLAPPQTYTIRLLRPEDAIGVVRCVFQTYGYTYPSPDIYYPQRIVELNNRGVLISAVAVSDLTGEVVGHCSLQRYGSGPFAENGQGVVAHAHRGRALAARLIKLLDEEAPRVGLRCLVGHEVTNHPAMQILTSRAGYKPCAIVLGSLPATTNFKKMTEVLPQRESCSVSLKILVPPEPTVICAPSHHRNMLERIYASLEKPVTFQTLPSPSGAGEIAVEPNRLWGIGDIHVRRIGTDTPADIRRCLRDLCEISDAEVVYLELPLDQGGIDDICRSAEADGFFFVGLGPSSVTGGESLYLQYLNTEIDFTHIQIATSMGREILEYVAQERQRVGTLERHK